MNKHNAFYNPLRDKQARRTYEESSPVNKLHSSQDNTAERYGLFTKLDTNGTALLPIIKIAHSQAQAKAYQVDYYKQNRNLLSIKKLSGDYFVTMALDVGGFSIPILLNPQRTAEKAWEAVESLKIAFPKSSYHRVKRGDDLTLAPYYLTKKDFAGGRNE